MKYTLALLVFATLLATCAGRAGEGILGTCIDGVYRTLSEVAMTAKDVVNSGLTVAGKIMDAL